MIASTVPFVTCPGRVQGTVGTATPDNDAQWRLLTFRGLRIQRNVKTLSPSWTWSVSGSDAAQKINEPRNRRDRDRMRVC